MGRNSVRMSAESKKRRRRDIESRISEGQNRNMSVHANGSIRRLTSIFICQKCTENSPLLRDQGKAGSLYVLPIAHSATFVLFNDILFFSTW